MHADELVKLENIEKKVERKVKEKEAIAKYLKVEGESERKVTIEINPKKNQRIRKTRSEEAMKNDYI